MFANHAISPIKQPGNPTCNQSDTQNSIEDTGTPAPETSDESHRPAGLEIPVEVECGGNQGENSQADKEDKDKIFGRFHRLFHFHRTRTVGIFTDRHIDYITRQ